MKMFRPIMHPNPTTILYMCALSPSLSLPESIAQV